MDKSSEKKSKHFFFITQLGLFNEVVFLDEY